MSDVQTPRGDWTDKLVVKEYPEIKPESIVDDPAEYAVTHGMAGVHTDETITTVGVWRWAGLCQHRTVIKQLVTAGPTMDFGGYAAPLGYGADVVDFFHPDCRAPYDAPRRYRCVFTSHTLEHIPDLPCVVMCLINKIVRPGHLIVFVPSSRLEHLQADHWPHHCHTFCLSSDEDKRPGWIEFDAMLAGCRGTIRVCERTTDNCLLGIVSLP